MGTTAALALQRVAALQLAGCWSPCDAISYQEHNPRHDPTRPALLNPPPHRLGRGLPPDAPPPLDGMERRLPEPRPANALAHRAGPGGGGGRHLLDPRVPARRQHRSRRRQA